MGEVERGTQQVAKMAPKAGRTDKDQSDNRVEVPSLKQVSRRGGGREWFHRVPSYECQSPLLRD